MPAEGLPAARLHADGVKAALETTGRPVGDGEGRDASRQPLTAPYMVLYDLAGGSHDGPVARPDDDVDWPFQVTCVGTTAEQARAMADRARDVLLTRGNVTVEGRHVDRVQPDGGLGGVQRDDDTPERPLFYLAPRFRLRTTPA